MKMLATSLLLLAGLAGCMDTVGSNQLATKDGSNNIRRSYSYVFDEATQKYSFDAIFYASGTHLTTVRLDPPSRLRVNGVDVAGRNTVVLGTDYYVDLPGGAPTSTVTIEWTDQLGDVFRDAMTMQSFSFSAPAQFSSEGEGTIQISNPIPGAEYSATLKGPSKEKADRPESASASSQGGTLRFSAADLAKLTRGPVTLAVEQRVPVSLNLHGNGKEGSGRVVYRATPRSVVLQ